MNAYSELYLDDAMCNLGEMLDYAVNDCGYELEVFYEWFVFSRIGELFSKGNPKYVTGMSGVELARAVVFMVKGIREDKEPTFGIERSKEYWVGWSLAHYQHYKNKPFADMLKKGLTADFVLTKYLLHEADISKFVEVADLVVENYDAKQESALKRLRKYYHMTQRELSDKSGVSLRMIQLYEQKQNDITKAQSNIVLSLAEALNCDVKDILM